MSENQISVIHPAMQNHLIGLCRTLLPFLAVITLITACTSQKDKELTGAGKDWPVYLADNFSSHYSKLAEINRENVDKLELAWEYHTGDDVSMNRTQIQCNPIIIDGILYGTSPRCVGQRPASATESRYSNP